MSIRAYVYGAKAPQQLKDVSERLYLGHQYYNKLVEIEQSCRKRNDAILEKYSPGLAELKTEYAELNVSIKELEDALKKSNQAEGRKKRKSPVTDLRKQRTALGKSIRAKKNALRAVEYPPEVQALEIAYKALKASSNSKIRAKLKSELQQMQLGCGGYEGELVASRMTAEASNKALYNESPLFWCHKNNLADAFKTACKKYPKFHKFDYHGKLYTQIQKKTLNLDTSKVFEKNRWFYITGTGKKMCAWIRYASIGIEPVFMEVPMVMHRPLPAGVIKGVSLVRRKCATKMKWEVQITVSCTYKSDATENNIAVGIDLGWRKTPEGIKVAHLIGEDGHEDVLILPKRFLDHWKQVESLQSIRDDKFNAVLFLLRSWLKSHDIPEWLQEATSHIHSWKSQRRLAGLIFKWRVNRFSGDVAILHLLDGSLDDSKLRKSNIKHWNGWRCWDKHLYEWQENLRQKTSRWRLDTYRKFAAQLSRRYGVLFMEDAVWSSTMRKSNAEDASNDIIKGGQRIASPGLLRKILESRFTLAKRVKHKGTTSDCSDCGQWNDIGAKSTYRCTECGLTIDRDANACLNILRRGRKIIAKGPVVLKTP